MPKAKYHASAVDVSCGSCGGIVPNPGNGSGMWIGFDLEKHAGKSIDCLDCGKPNVIRKPKVVPVAD